MQYRFSTSTNPLYWFCIELSEDGQMFSKRLSKEMITFDTKGREGIQVNEHDVVLFREQETARRILSVPGNTVFDLQEYDRIAHAHQRHKELSMEGKIASAPQP